MTLISRNQQQHLEKARELIEQDVSDWPEKSWAQVLQEHPHLRAGLEQLPFVETESPSRSTVEPAAR